MRYTVNGRNLAVGRLMVRGPKADKRLKHIQVGPKGTSVFTPLAVARVSLPEAQSYIVPAIIPQAQLDAMPVRPTPESNDTIDLPEGLPAVTGPEYIVPNIDACLPSHQFTTATFTCDGDLLRKLLTIACEVSKDSTKTLRLRICNDINALRIDTYRQPGDQEFVGVLKGIDYDGDYIPGEAPSDKPKIEKKPVQRGIALKIDKGRRFR